VLSDSSPTPTIQVAINDAPGGAAPQRVDIISVPGSSIFVTNPSGNLFCRSAFAYASETFLLLDDGPSGTALMLATTEPTLLQFSADLFTGTGLQCGQVVRYALEGFAIIGGGAVAPVPGGPAGLAVEAGSVAFTDYNQLTEALDTLPQSLDTTTVDAPEPTFGNTSSGNAFIYAEAQ
jgi:hypothetical protein